MRSKVLIVDDSLTVRMELKEALDEHEVFCTASGQEALELLSYQPVDAILMDLIMPGLSGMETCERIKAQNAWRDIPLLILTAQSDSTALLECIRAGADDYITKSPDYMVLKARLGAQLRRRNYEEENRAFREQLQQGQKMEAIGRLAGGVAHDFNNLLMVIMGHLGFIQEGGGLEGEHRESLTEVLACSERAAGLTKQLLAVSRRQALQRRAVDLNAVVGEVADMLQRIIGEDVELSFDLQADLPYVLADPGQLQQVLMNLVVNARDAMPTGGALFIATSLEGSSKQGDGPQVLLTVRDTGIGISGEVLAHIFEPFFTTKEIGKGTGLGLAIIYGIVKQSGGHISVESVPGRGTSFKVYLPMIQDTVAVPAEPELVSTPASLRGTETLLLVEDERGVRELVSHLLVRQGYRILQAAKPEDALLLAGQPEVKIQLLLTDVTMPQMNGRALAARVKDLIPGIKVLYMSGYAQAEVLDGIEKDGGAYLPKPFTSQKLLQKLREVLA